MWRGIDKRKFPRANYNCSVVLRRPKSDVVMTTHTENIGVGGLCVMLDKPLEIFSEVELELLFEPNTPIIKCKGSIVWVVRRANFDKSLPETYDTGIEFLDISEDDKAKVEKIVEEIIAKEKSA